jgi:nicotinamide-nucleotide amidase
MRADVISIGDELITGQRLDTNSQWLSQRLTEIGVDVAFHTTIGDHLADNVAAFTDAISRADVVVVTGGLGPTADDLTREALAKAVGVGLVRDEASLEHIRQLFASRGREMPERNVAQADFPEGAVPIRNQQGTAPGIHMRVERVGALPCLVFALPGVPAEMKPMWQETVAPAVLAARGEARVIRHRCIKCFGVGESQLEAMLPDLIRRGREPSVGITVSDATITLRITAAGADDAACMTAMEPTVGIIRDSLASIVYGEEEEELEDVVVRLLAERNQTVAVAEWATGGMLSKWLANASGEQAVFAGGLVLDSKRKSVGILESVGHAWYLPHESRAASAVAEAVRRSAKADFGIGVAAFPSEPDEPNAVVYVSIATPERTRRLRFATATHPAIRLPLTAKRALNALRLILLDEEVGDG